MAADSTPLRWGILATGGIAGTFATDLRRHGFDLRAVGSRSVESARAFAATHEIPRAHGSYEELAADPEVDIVYVATPHTMHAENTRLALSHGKHVLVEKAFTLNATEAHDVAQAARAAGRVVMEAMWTRFLPHMVWIRQALAESRIGTVLSVTAEHGQHLPFGDGHRLRDPQLGGGALLDLGVYPLSFLHDVVGAPDGLNARATFTPLGVDASVATVSTHAGGVLATTFSSMDARGRNQATILGDQGRLEIDATWYAPTSVTHKDNAGDVVEVFRADVPARGMQYQAAELERVIRAGDAESPLMPLDESIAVMGTMDRVREQIGLRYPGE
ncbi:Gfo/Idh/MocA family protein [Ruania alba]|uniref:Predicted dehydrogenase n=1 Tax=Ruania alba TaxID=648782 RepID=A0A1H5M5R2_9MICO|nr:Gfo/Idh/MocA family oxidoreductase [Ruania alba]SEE84799.1 Predicted dehydrogenase [Ruania alba]